jgi:hypothetical protein
VHPTSTQNKKTSGQPLTSRLQDGAAESRTITASDQLRMSVLHLHAKVANPSAQNMKQTIVRIAKRIRVIDIMN